MTKIIGRPKTFKTDEVIYKAMNHFWIHGYDNSSLDDLLKVMGIKKSSFYSTFKNKEELFSLSLDLYMKEALKSLEKITKEKGLKKGLIEHVVTTIKNLENFNSTTGCLLINSGKECHGKYKNLSQKITLQFYTLMEFFIKIIEEAKTDKEITNPLDSKVIASRFINSFSGLVIIKQAGADNETINNILDYIEELLS